MKAASGVRSHEEGQVVLHTAVGGAVAQHSRRLLQSVTLAQKANGMEKIRNGAREKQCNLHGSRMRCSQSKCEC